MVPLLVLLQAHLCGEHRLTVGAAVTQLLSYGGLVETQTSRELSVETELPPCTQLNDGGQVFPFILTNHNFMKQWIT